MKIETLIELLKLVHSIGESKEHFVSMDYSTNKACFTACVYIHNKNEFGTSNGFSSTYHFESDSDFYLNRRYLEGWLATIEWEREEDAAS